MDGRDGLAVAAGAGVGALIITVGGTLALITTRTLRVYELFAPGMVAVVVTGIAVGVSVARYVAVRERAKAQVLGWFDHQDRIRAQAWPTAPAQGHAHGLPARRVSSTPVPRRGRVYL